VALIEALAAARPVVATKVGGVPFVVEHGVTGLLAALDPEALATGIERAMSDRPAASAMAETGRIAVAERFSHDRLVRDMRGLYRELLGAP